MGEGFPRQQARTRRFSLGAPRSFTVAPDGSRVVFLRSMGGDDPVNRLWVHDLASGRATVVADPMELLGTSDVDLPPEERARRERAREAGEGIVTYATDPEVRGAVFALGGRLYTTDLSTAETAGLPAEPGAFDPRPDPTGHLVAYVAAGALYITDLEHGSRLVAGSDDPDVSFGVAEFVAAEEMRRSRGYWWAPGGEALLVARADNRAVPRWHIANPIDPAARPISVRYPAAGTTNATVSLFVHRVDGAEFEPVEVLWDQAGTWEYLVDASWGPEPTPTIVVSTRDQRTMAVCTVDPMSGVTEERYRWTDPTWIDIVAGAPTWVDGRLVTVEDRGPARRVVVDGEPITPDDLQIRAIVQADEHGILAVASPEAPEQQLVHVALDGTVTRLTDSPGVHNAATAGDVIVISSAGLDHDGTTTRIVVAGAEVATIENLAETPDIDLSLTFLRSGPRELHTAVLLPSNADPDTPLPVLLDPYGGPHAQRVVHARAAYGASQWFADQGFAVVVCDGAGTPGRGPAFEREVWGDLAGPVLDDQLAALEAVAETHPGLDLDRVGIRGWSFGGDLAALAVLRRPDRFHAGIAGAPVTDWRLYDTHYTERYLGHPADHPEHYTRTDLTREAANLRRPLLLIHGLADDNVVAAHTLVLSRALLEAGRPHQVLPLSGVTHMTPQEVVAENLLLLQRAFLETSLGIADPSESTP